MLEWKEINGYNNEKGYKWQEGVELPELNEEILIEFQNETNPNRPPFVGYFNEDRNGYVWMIISANGGMSLYKVQDGVRWARFNRPWTVVWR